MNLYWFRSDLRLADNTALHHATQNDKTIALFIITPEQWQQHDEAVCKIDLWLRQLDCLADQLHKAQIPLLIAYSSTWQDVPNLISNLCQKLEIDHVFCNQEYGINERLRDEQTEIVLQKHDIEFSSYHDRVIFPVGSIKNKSDDYYKVFGAFKKACYARLYTEDLHLAPYVEPKKQPKITLKLDDIAQKYHVQAYTKTKAKQKDSLGHLAILEQLNKKSDVKKLYQQLSELSEDIRSMWAAGEDEAWRRLDNFMDDAVEDYAKARDFPALDGTSQLSAYLNAGILSIRQCLRALQQAHPAVFSGKQVSAKVWLDELLWREFYQHILYGFADVSKHQPFKNVTQKLKWRNDETELKAWQDGQTGIPIIDAAMRQLKATGWMHNRLRMLVAVFLSKNLLIDWRKGEQWFMQHLIDGELAANNGGWQWSASTGTDSVPYFRVFNPIAQSQKFDPDGDFLRKWLPELAELDNKAIHAPFQSKQKDKKIDYPAPIVDLKQSREDAISAFRALKTKS